MRSYKLLPGFTRHMPCRILVVALLLLPAAGSSRADQIDQLVMSGIESIYNVRFDDAARLFDQAIAADPDDPRGYFFRANVHLWSYLFDSRREQLTLFMDASDRAMAVAQKRISVAPGDTRARLFLGMSYGYRAIAHARAENFTAAALSAKTCYDRLNDVVKTDPKLYDAYLGLGLFHFMFGSIPRIGQIIVGLSGIRGDAPLGVREIQASAARGAYFRNDAQFIVAMLDIYYNNKSDDGLRALGTMIGKYPRNVALLYSVGIIQLNRRQSAEAVKYFEKVVRQDNGDFRLFTGLSYGQLGKAQFLMNNFSGARGYLQKFLKVSQEKTMRTSAWYMLGVSYEMDGDRTNAMKAYDRAVNGSVAGSPEDHTGNRRAAILLRAPMTANDKNTLRAVNAMNGGNLQEAARYAGMVINDPGVTRAQLAQALYVSGFVLFATIHYDDAISAFLQAVAILQDETWVYPYSYFHLAECYKNQGDREKWQLNLDRARQYHNYDNEVELRFKIQRDVSTID